MTYEELMLLVKKLTGTAVEFCKSDIKESKGENDSCEVKLLNKILDDISEINWNQLNEILLLCNKDRVSKGFFDLFFKERLGLSEKQSSISLEDLKTGVDQFRRIAMLGFGSYIIAYKELSPLTKEEIKSRRDLQIYFRDPKIIRKEMVGRPKTLKGIEEIDSESTHLVGYLSGTSLDSDLSRADCLKEILRKYSQSNSELLSYLKDCVEKNFEGEVSSPALKIAEGYLTNICAQSIERLKEEILKVSDELHKRYVKREQILGKACVNSDIYLTWDYMDVYIATSMRHEWEYRSVYNFLGDLFKRSTLSNLKIRYFNPTQSYEKISIDKGLIEGLMLKRAQCTIYLVQETDTFGKDSELAATLAQGKPVIAYVPKITEDNFERHLNIIRTESERSLEFLRDKLILLLEYSSKPSVLDEARIKSLNIEDLYSFVTDLERKITDRLQKKVWKSIKTPWVSDDSFIAENKDSIEKACAFVAVAGKYYYDRRSALFKQHPLGIQINLATGVANGVLVVRSISDCQKLLENILTNTMEFEELHEGEDEKGYWYLKEKTSGSTYRVVTDRLKITNSFWNFYKGE